MSDHARLLALALIGTGRGTLPPPGETPLEQAAARLVRPDPEGTLLARAALFTLTQTAGRLPDPAADPPTPAPAEALPEAPPRAARHLPLVLNTPLLPEWLTLCAGAGWRVPAAHLPDLLDLARHDTALRGHLRPVLGERGAWLAGFNAEWGFAPASLDDDAWADATDAAREAVFRSLRDRDPEAARDLLTTHLPTERAASRRRLLGALLDTLTPDDVTLEPLLEALLHDRSDDVRVLARRALGRLPSSAYSARMGARLAALVHLSKPGVLGRLKGETSFTLTLPTVPDPDSQRDGMALNLGAPAVLSLLIESTHAETLLTALNLTPAQAVALARQHDALEALLAGTVASGHRELAAALLPSVPHDPHLLLLGPPEGLRGALDQALRAADAERLLPLLDALPAPWPADLTPHLCDTLRRSLGGVEYLYAWPYRWREIYALILERADPTAPGSAELLDDTTPYAQQLLGELRGTFDLRRAMGRDFEVGAG